MKTVVTQFLEQAGKYPKNPAVLDIRGTYTYERMNNRSAYLAEQILKGQPQEIRLILMVEFFVVVYGILILLVVLRLSVIMKVKQMD